MYTATEQTETRYWKKIIIQSWHTRSGRFGHDTENFLACFADLETQEQQLHQTLGKRWMVDERRYCCRAFPYRKDLTHFFANTDQPQLCYIFSRLNQSHSTLQNFAVHDAVSVSRLIMQVVSKRSLHIFNRDVLQTEIRKLRRRRAAAGWEVRNKMAHFRENPSERSARGPWNRTKFSVRFSLAGSSLPMWPCASAVWDCRTAHQLLLFLSLLQLCHHFRDRRALQHQFCLLQLQYVLQLRSPGSVITKPSISPSEGVVTREKAWKRAFCS